MSIVLFGNGPLPIHADQAVMAPGSRTWQILRAVLSSNANQETTVILLDDKVASQSPVRETIEITGAFGAKRVQLISLAYTEFVAMADAKPDCDLLPADIKAVIATGSAQPYSTGARFAHAHGIPVWVDVFGDPFAEIQTQFEINADDQEDADQTKLVHIWKLMNDALLYGDRFSALSDRQRFALLGQLGCAGRLNQFTAESSDFVETIPYGLWEDDLKQETAAETIEDTFTVLWAGSFNTWMDVPTLANGLIGALKNDPDIRLVVVGGKISGYNETSYNQFLEIVRQSGVEGSITLLDWQPLAKMAELYRVADIGICIDRDSYEAELGSRTRLVNFVAGGLPVISTVITELSEELTRAGYVISFEIGDADGLTKAILKAKDNRAELSARKQTARQFILQNYNAFLQTKGLQTWLAAPETAADKQSDAANTNNLFYQQANLRASLGV